ncbi:PilW family protein [Zobellella taiwanensis]
MSFLNRQNGISLVEMLVSLVAGLVVVAGGISLFVSVMVSGNTTLMLSRLNQDVQAVTDMIARDIQRAGYHPSAAIDIANEVSLASSIASQYMFSTDNDLFPSGGVATCIRVKYWEPDPPSGMPGGLTRIYSYDANNNRLRVNSLYSAIVTSPLASVDCDAGSMLVSDLEVDITSLEFELVSGSNPTGARALDIRVTANSAQKNNLSMTLERRVRLRNDGY